MTLVVGTLVFMLFMSIAIISYGMCSNGDELVGLGMLMLLISFAAVAVRGCSNTDNEIKLQKYQECIKGGHSIQNILGRDICVM